MPVSQELGTEAAYQNNFQDGKSEQISDRDFQASGRKICRVKRGMIPFHLVQEKLFML